MGLLQKESTTGIAAALSQLSVLLAALLVMAWRGRDAFRRVGWRLGPAWAYLVVLMGTLALVAVANSLSLHLGWMQWMTEIKPTQVAFSLLFVFGFSGVCAFAEEFGWRGFLLPALQPLGIRRALLLSGGLWFLWEAPLVMGGVLYPKMRAASLAGALILHFFQVCGVATLYGYLRLRFTSVWLPAFAHAVLNTLGAASIMLLSTINPVWAGFGGPVGVALVVGLAGWVFWRLPALRKTESRPEPLLTPPVVRHQTV